jgi:putative DNA primase/helicase
LCLGFAAPLLRFADIESGGFHFWGPSSRGKSTLQLAAATIFGSGERDGGYTRKWNATASAVDECALGHSDHLLNLDEMQLLGGGPKIIAQRASETAYSIASGTPKSRSAHFSPLVPTELQRYRTLLLSSGEISVTEHARADGTQRLAGEEARLIDVPVPARPAGIFDRLPRRKPTLTSGLLAEKLREAAAQTYGTAGRAYVEALVADCGADERALRKRLSLGCQRFLHKARVDMDDAYAVRFAKRFALAYAAGLLAIDYGIVPWKRSLLWRCVRRVYREAISIRASAPDPLESVVSNILTRLPQLAADAVDIKDPKKARSASMLRLTRNGQQVLALRSSAFKQLVGSGVSEKTVAAELERRRVLVPRNNGRRTCQVSVPGTKKRRDYYCLRLDRKFTKASKTKIENSQNQAVCHL